jgi:hypothetical protein
MAAKQRRTEDGVSDETPYRPTQGRRVSAEQWAQLRASLGDDAAVARPDEPPEQLLERLLSEYAAAPLAPSSDLAARFAAPREEPQF